MLDRLPTELLIHVLSYLDPMSPDRISSRRDLYNCCLTTRRMRIHAQPLLWRQLKTGKTLDKAPDELCRHVQVLVVDGAWYYDPKCAVQVNWMTFEGGLKDVRLRNFQGKGEYAAILFSLLTSTQRLVLDTIDFDPYVPCPSPRLFPHLVSFSIFNLVIAPTFLSTFLQRDYLPNLRFLRLSVLADPYEPDTFYFPEIKRDFLKQLSVLQIELECLETLGAMPAQGQCRLLVSSSLEALSNVSTIPSQVHHFHIEYFPLTDLLPYYANQPEWKYADFRRAREESLACLPDLLRRSQLSTILFPLSLQHPALEKAFGLIKEACIEKGIEVLWEDDEPQMDDVFCLREEFCRWAADQRRREKETAIAESTQH
ncbi:hypothetical protein JCM11251_007910 [Rhodosporidiobolus azoricus]